jgi:hypothetical protein
MGKNMYINILVPDMKLKISYVDMAAVTLVAKYPNGKIT